MVMLQQPKISKLFFFCFTFFIFVKSETEVKRSSDFSLRSFLRKTNSPTELNNCLKDNKILWEENGLCYKPATRGPCQENHWIVLRAKPSISLHDKQVDAVCILQPCPIVDDSQANKRPKRSSFSSEETTTESLASQRVEELTEDPYLGSTFERTQDSSTTEPSVEEKQANTRIPEVYQNSDDETKTSDLVETIDETTTTTISERKSNTEDEASSSEESATQVSLEETTDRFYNLNVATDNASEDAQSESTTTLSELVAPGFFYSGDLPNLKENTLVGETNTQLPESESNDSDLPKSNDDNDATTIGTEVYSSSNNNQHDTVSDDANTSTELEVEVQTELTDDSSTEANGLKTINKSLYSVTEQQEASTTEAVIEENSTNLIKTDEKFAYSSTDQQEETTASATEIEEDSTNLIKTINKSVYSGSEQQEETTTENVNDEESTNLTETANKLVYSKTDLQEETTTSATEVEEDSSNLIKTINKSVYSGSEQQEESTTENLNNEDSTNPMEAANTAVYSLEEQKQETTTEIDIESIETNRKVYSEQNEATTEASEQAETTTEVLKAVNKLFYSEELQQEDTTANEKLTNDEENATTEYTTAKLNEHTTSVPELLSYNGATTISDFSSDSENSETCRVIPQEDVPLCGEGQNIRFNPFGDPECVCKKHYYPFSNGKNETIGSSDHEGPGVPIDLTSNEPVITNCYRKGLRGPCEEDQILVLSVKLEDELFVKCVSKELALQFGDVQKDPNCQNDEKTKCKSARESSHSESDNLEDYLDKKFYG